MCVLQNTDTGTYRNSDWKSYFLLNTLAFPTIETSIGLSFKEKKNEESLLGKAAEEEKETSDSENPAKIQIQKFTEGQIKQIKKSDVEKLKFEIPSIEEQNEYVKTITGTGDFNMVLPLVLVLFGGAVVLVASKKRFA